MSQVFSVSLQVRDYELDQYGVVNNAVYLNYLEHARHEFLLHLGIPTAAADLDGRALALAGINVRFKAPLRSHDMFRVTVDISELRGARAVFHQCVLRDADAALMVEAWAEAVFLDERGRPMRVAPDVRDKLSAFLQA